MEDKGVEEGDYRLWLGIDQDELGKRLCHSLTGKAKE